MVVGDGSAGDDGATTVVQGWGPDPLGRHEERYFSDGVGTWLVRDAGVESRDDSTVSAADAVGLPRQSRTPVPPVIAETGADPAVRFPQRAPAASRLAVRAIAAGVVVVVAAGGVTAASRQSGSGRRAASPAPAPKAVGLAAAAYATTVSAGSAKIATTFTLSIGTSTMTSTGSGAYAWSTKRGEFTTRIRYGGATGSDPSASPSVSASASASPAAVSRPRPANSSVTVVGSATVSGKVVGQLTSATQRVIYDGANTYLQDSSLDLPPSVVSRLSLPTGHAWTESTWSNSSSASLLDWGSFSVIGGAPDQVDPSSILALLRDSATSVETLGNSSVAGVSTTGYRAMIPLVDLLGLSPSERTAADRAIGDRSTTFDFWVDAAGRLRRMTTSIPIPAKSTEPASQGSISATLTLSDYGVAVTAAPPPADQIIARSTCSVTDDGFSCSGP